jgi:branched-subunit amino acid aminotransferase/4-amino-4-deoxychorismate lyase
MKALGFEPVDVTEEGLLKQIGFALERGGFNEGRVRITVSDETPSHIWHRDCKKQSLIQTIAAGPRQISSSLLLTLSPFPVNSKSPLAGIKSCNYLENVLAIDEVKNRGFHEAVRLNERREVTGGCMSNIFWLKNDQLFTPSLKTGCLPGTTREYVLESLNCREVEAGIAYLQTADQIFLTSAGLGVTRVAEFGGRKLSENAHDILGLWPPRDAKTRTPTKSDP